MKKYFEKLCFGGALLFGLSMSLTSCEGALDDILGEWSRPVPGSSTGGGGSSTINATAIALDQTMKVIKLGGDALTIKATVTPTDATDKTVTWESKDPTIATVENGVVTPVGLGITTITAKSGELSATCEVFVGTEVDLSSETADYNTNDYDILSGDIGAHYINIPYISGGCHVAFNGMATTKGISCMSDATIYLIDGKTNTVTATSNYPGIWIGVTGKTLTINAETEGTGILNATGGSGGGAGIGTGGATGSNVENGNIEINGGVINATGGGSVIDGGAGIGTGTANNKTNKCGDITINGGTVTAKGGNIAAGIGTGVGNYGTNTCGDITINGGTVTATGVVGSAGIGTGLGSGISNTCGAITIGAGVKSVTATKDNYSPNSIGMGDTAAGTQTCGKIKFGTAEVFDGASTWDTSIIFNTDGDYGPYGGLNLNISTKTNANDTWTLTPAP